MLMTPTKDMDLAARLVVVSIYGLSAGERTSVKHTTAFDDCSRARSETSHDVPS